jgi:hypothetical protein
MISQVSPEEFSSAYQNGKATVTLSVTMPAETLANIRAVSYALGSLSVEQLVENSLRAFMFMDSQEMVVFQEQSWVWDDPKEKARLEQVKAIAEECWVPWPLKAWTKFRAEVAKLRPFWRGSSGESSDED